MKRKLLITIIIAGIGVFSCRKVTVGYLTTEYAGYQVDSMIVKTELDTTPPVEIPNPLYDLYISYGFTPEDLLLMGILPTFLEGGGEDYDRNRRSQPWVSTAIEGVQGTMPIVVSVEQIKTTDGNAEKLRENLSVRSNGMLTVPLAHDIPPGNYYISLQFKNEGYIKIIPDVFRIIVK